MKGNQKQQINYVLAGFTGTLFLGLLTNVAIPFFTDRWDSTTVAPVLTLFLVGFVAYAVVRHQLFDIRFFAVRASAYITTLFVTAGLMVAPIILIFGHFLDFHPTFSEFLLVVISSVTALYVIQYLRTVFDRVTNRLFLRHYYDPQDVLDSLGDALAQTADISLLQERCADIIVQAVKPRYIEYLLFASRNKHESILAKEIAKLDDSNVIVTDDLEEGAAATLLRKENIAVALKLRTTHEDLGYIVLGFRQSGQWYSARDTKMLSVAASEIAIGLQNALRFEEIERFNETLQEKVEDATRKLKATNRKLKKLNESKDDFIGMASHQLRTPLTSAKGYISLVLDEDAGPINKEQRKLLEQAFASSQRMVYLIADLLNVSRLKTGKFTIERVPTHLPQLIKDEMEQLKSAVAAHDISLTFAAPKHFPSLQLDATKTRQVVMNFLDNALYYTPNGGHITVELKELPKSVEFRVIDDGIGVPKEEQHNLFTKFYRAKNAQRARPDGTGLGLYMAQKVVSAQGGAIIFKSKEGKGSEFGFSFPKNMPADAPVVPELAAVEQ